jgi:hypothetical protein
MEVAVSAWDDSHWIDYDAYILHVFSGGAHAWLEYRYTIWYVGWRRLRVDSPEDSVNIVTIATAAKHSGLPVRVRVTNGGGPDGLAEITAIQTK